jgi:hypothetical protein
MALCSTQPLIEMSTRNLPGSKWRPARKADDLIAICEPVIYKNVGASTSHKPMGLHGLWHYQERLCWADHVGRIGETMRLRRSLVAQPLANRPLGRPKGIRLYRLD